MIEYKDKYLLSQFLFKSVVDILATSKRKEKNKNQIEKKNFKPSLFTDVINMYIENSVKCIQDTRTNRRI